MAIQDASNPAATAESPVRARRRLPPELSILGVMVGMMLLFEVLGWIFVGQSFIANPLRLKIMILQEAEIGIIAVGVTQVIIMGGIDLSSGSVVGMTAMFAASLAQEADYSHAIYPALTGLNPIFPVVAGLLGGLIIGLINGSFIAYTKIPPFIATLGMMLVNKGLALVVAGDKPIYFNDTEGFSTISQGSVIGYILPSVPVPNSVVILFVLAIGASLLLNRTALGRYTFALGSNEEAVRLSGVNVDRWKIAIYMLAGAICGIAGLLIASRLNSAQPALGQGYELEAIAAVVIGGTSLSGGTGTVLGTIIGAFIMSVLTNGLRILSVPQEWQIVVTGVIIILAVYIDILRRRKL